jgi:hypothetical protein
MGVNSHLWVAHLGEESGFRIFVTDQGLGLCVRGSALWKFIYTKVRNELQALATYILATQTFPCFLISLAS